MGAGHSAEGDGCAYASDPPSHERRKSYSRRRRHSVDSVASYSSQNHVDRIRTQNFSAASCQDDGDLGSIKTNLFRRSSSNLEVSNKRPESVISNTSSTRSRLREFVERKTSQDEHKSAANTVGDIQYFENPTETLEFDRPRNSLDSKKGQDERPKKRKLSKSKDKDKDKDLCENKNKKHEKYQSKLAEYYKLPVQLPQDEFYQHLTRSKAADDLLQKRFANSDTEFSGSYGRLCKHKESEGSNLRRSRSLAVIREETFTDLQIQNHAKSKRSQLIPRARLFDKPCFKDRLPGRAKYQTKEEVLENIYIDSTASCFGDINAQKENEIQIDNIDNRSEKEEVVSRNESRQSRSIAGSWPTLNEDTKPNHLSEDSVGHSRNPSEIDSLDSNYVRKHYNFDAHRKGYKDSSPDTERSVVSPDHSKDLYITTDDHDTDQEDKDRSKNNTPKSFTNDSLSITHSEKDPKTDRGNTTDLDSYDEVSLKSKQSEKFSKLEPDTSQKNTEIITDVDVESVVSENDGTISSPPDSITSYISISIASSADKSHKLEYLANSLAEKIDEYCDSQFKDNSSIPSQTVTSENNNPDTDPIYTKVNKKKTFADIKRDSFLSKSSNIFNEIQKKENSEVYVSNTYIESDNYTAKGICASNKNITTEPFVTTLIENQYYSLPDINISKCLRKSERIDAQLREEDPEDIPCENTYEIAQTHFREILSVKGTENYGQLNKTHINNNNNVHNSLYISEYSEPLQNFNKLEDDLKSIITIESSNPEDSDAGFYRTDTLQNERELNEIEGTIRNNKVITKSESFKLNCNSVYRPTINLSKSYSNDNINKGQFHKPKVGIKKHYSLRQRDPVDDEIHRLPSPSIVERSLKPTVSASIKSFQIDEKKTPLLSRVQSFKTSADSSIALVPLSGHQTIVIDPPVTQDSRENKIKIIQEAISKPHKFPENHPKGCKPAKKSKKEALLENSQTAKEIKTSTSSVDTSSFCIPKDPFITIKLNKVVKTTLPKLKKEASDKFAGYQYKFEKPPPRLIIKDNKDNLEPLPPPKLNQVSGNMTRPQVLQVVDSKNKKENVPTEVDKSSVPSHLNESSNTNSTKVDINLEIRDDIRSSKSDVTVKEKINNAIKTDIEYQEKINSVKSYWSKLIDNSPEFKDGKEEMKEELNVMQDDLNNNDDQLKLTTDIDKNEDSPSLPEISVENIIKSLESVKIVDSIRKTSQPKILLWKDEAEKVKSDSEIEEPTVQKIVKDSETNQVYEKPKPISFEKDLCRDTPEIEIVELSSDDNFNQKTQATLIKAKGFEPGCDEFDHVRYKVMKSELFKNSMIANYRKEAQFDGLLQYLQDYSFQELLVNNNIVIIEPVRTKIEPMPRKNTTDTCKIPPAMLKKNESNCSQIDKSKNAIRRHFFYHPIRVNKEIIEEELPNPDTVKKVRNLFEDTLKMKSPMTHDPPLIDELGLPRRATSYRNLNEEAKGNKIGGRKKVIRQLTIETNFVNKKWDNVSMSSGVSSGDLSSNNEYETDGLSSYSHKNLNNVYSSSDEYLCDSMSQDFCCESQYVSPEILKKIRECGTSVTYYGGKVLNSKTGSSVSPMTKAIMEEIKSLQKSCSRDCYSCQTKCRGEKCSCLIADKHKQTSPGKLVPTPPPNSEVEDKSKRTEGFPGFKFKLVKSNSCSSRLELTGTDDNKNPRFRYRKQLSTEDPPIVLDDENSVKNKICRLESYSKGIVNTPFENKEDSETRVFVPKKPIEQYNKVFDSKTNLKKTESTVENKIVKVAPIKIEENKQNVEKTQECMKSLTFAEKQAINDAHSFEKKFYYVNDNLDQRKPPAGKFGEMVFEEFEVLESCYDSLNSNKSLK